MTTLFKGNGKKFKLSGAQIKWLEVRKKTIVYCTVYILITFTCRNVNGNLRDILLDYKSEQNVTKNSPNRACFLLFWEVKLFTLHSWQTTSAFNSKLYAHNTSMGNSKFNVSDATTLFFLNFLSTQNMFRIISGKIVQKWSEGKQKLLPVSRRCELLRVRVTEGKITVNVWRKTSGNWFCLELAQGKNFKLARVRVIRSRV